MDRYSSVTFISSNENGQQELILEEEWPVWKFLWFAAIGKWKHYPETNIRTYVVQGTVWAEKETGIIPNRDIQIECFEAKAYAKRQAEMNDFFGGNYKG